MKKERTIKELLQLMLDNQELFTTSLCTWKARLYLNDIITTDESISLAIFIDEHRPWVKIFQMNSGYYWSKGKIKPRIKWIKKYIAIL